MFFDNFLDRREAKARSGSFCREKGFEDFPDMLGWNRNPVVLHRDLHVPAGSWLRHLNVQMSSRCHGFERIFQDAEENLLHLSIVAANGADVRI